MHSFQSHKNIFVKICANTNGVIYFQLVFKLGHSIQFDFDFFPITTILLTVINKKDVHEREG